MKGRPGGSGGCDAAGAISQAALLLKEENSSVCTWFPLLTETDIDITIERYTGGMQDQRRIAGGMTGKMRKIGVFSFTEQC